VSTTTTKPQPTPTPAARVSADPGWVFRRAVNELRRDHPGQHGDTSPTQTLAAYARQADELAAMVEQYDTAHGRHITVLLHALGDLPVAMHELATRLAQRPAQTTAPVTASPDGGQ
jgi:hypothetical protein